MQNEKLGVKLKKKEKFVGWKDDTKLERQNERRNEEWRTWKEAEKGKKKKTEKKKECGNIFIWTKVLNAIFTSNSLGKINAQDVLTTH